MSADENARYMFVHNRKVYQNKRAPTFISRSPLIAIIIVYIFLHSTNCKVAKASTQMAVMPIAHFACAVKVKIGNTSNRILSRTQAESARMVKRVNLWVITGRVAMNVMNAP